MTPLKPLMVLIAAVLCGIAGYVGSSLAQAAKSPSAKVATIFAVPRSAVGFPKCPDTKQEAYRIASTAPGIIMAVHDLNRSKPDLQIWLCVDTGTF